MLTGALMTALNLVDIRTQDHFIVAGANAVSLAAQGLMGMFGFPESNEPSKKKTPARRKTQ